MLHDQSIIVGERWDMTRTSALSVFGKALCIMSLALSGNRIPDKANARI